VVGDVLARLEQGGILVPPVVAEDFLRSQGKPVPDGDCIEYEFGGEPDVVIDVMRSISGFAADAIVKHVKENPEQ
jgi:hypothetical protein